jgi:hypothetical protein
MEDVKTDVGEERTHRLKEEILRLDEKISEAERETIVCEKHMERKWCF